MGYRSSAAAWSWYAKAYAKYYGTDDADGAAVCNGLTEILPWEACEYCDVADDCATFALHCSCEADAWDTLAECEAVGDGLQSRLALNDSLYSVE